MHQVRQVGQVGEVCEGGGQRHDAISINIIESDVKVPEGREVCEVGAQ